MLTNTVHWMYSLEILHKRKHDGKCGGADVSGPLKTIPRRRIAGIEAYLYSK